MAGTKLTVQQRRDRRAKIMLAALGVVLLGVVALQLPKFMKGSGGGTPSATPASTTSTGPTALVSAPATGQLDRFSRFKPKNPFHSQMAAQTTTPTSTSPATSGTTTTPASAPVKPKPKKSAPSPITISVQQQPAVPVGPRVPAALLLINGKKTVVPLDTAYPAKHPLFKVVALSGDALWIQLIGGSLADGNQTVKLQQHRRVTLENATAGVKMVLTLLKPTTAPKPLLPPPTSTTPVPAVTPTTTTTSTTPTTTTSG